jgi:hypothetical protein
MMPLPLELPPLPPPPVEEFEVPDEEQPGEERLPAEPELEPTEELN